MKKNLKNFHIISVIIDMVLGTLLHFTYDLSGNNNFVALFSAINESTWEHLKLLFFPMLLTSIIGYIFFFNSNNSYWCSRLIGILISLTFTVIFFYTYSGILGKNIAFIDISSFFLSVILGELTSYFLLTQNIPCNKKYALFPLAALVFLFFTFTFNPPHIGLFKDPISNNYGVLKVK